MTNVIARESPDHVKEIRRLIIDAFTASEMGHNGEADLVDALREQCNDGISLVAIVDDRVVGHIQFSPATIRHESSMIHGVGLAPLAVHPTHQNQGIGSKLVFAGLRIIADSSAAFTIVAGYPEYYSRFGFVSAIDLSVKHGFAGMPQEVLSIHLPDAVTGERLAGGLAYYHPTFGSQHSE